MHSNRLPKQRAEVGLIATHSEGVCLFAAVLICKASLTQSIESMSKHDSPLRFIGPSMLALMQLIGL